MEIEYCYFLVERNTLLKRKIIFYVSMACSKTKRIKVENKKDKVNRLNFRLMIVRVS